MLTFALFNNSVILFGYVNQETNSKLLWSELKNCVESFIKGDLQWLPFQQLSTIHGLVFDQIKGRPCGMCHTHEGPKTLLLLLHIPL